MERTLSRFIRALRAAGADVSPAEAIDAARTVSIVGYANRDQLKDSLATVLAKSMDEKALHDQVFEMYFRAPAPAKGEHGKAKSDASQSKAPSNAEHSGSAAQSPAQSGAQSSGGGNADETERDSAAGKSAAGADSMLALAHSGDIDRIVTAIARAAAAAGVDDIRFESQKAYFVRRTMEQLGIDALEAELLEQLNQTTTQAQTRAQLLRDARSNMQQQVRAYVDQRYELYGRAASAEFMNDVVVNRALSQLTPHDIDRMKVVVARMAKRLAAKHSRRRRVSNRGQLDFRRTLRGNAGHDGVPFNIVWKHTRRNRPRIVAICDVSGSVAPYVRFLLLFLFALAGKVTDLRAFAFSDRLKDVAGPLETMSFDAAMARILRDLGGGSTDYGQAFADLQNDHWQAIDRHTTILILGDGRSNDADPRLDILREAADRAKRVVWLCTEPERRWGTGDSCMLEYQPLCTSVIHCATAADLERAVDEALIAYD